jgi:uncharacterized membrane protein
MEFLRYHDPVHRLALIGWLVLIALVTGFGAASSIKPIQIPFSILHKLSAIVCLVLISLRISGALGLFKSQPTITLTIWIFVAAFLAACVTGVVHSLPAQGGPLWLNLHRVAASVSAIACGVAARLIVVSAR